MIIQDNQSSAEILKAELTLSTRQLTITKLDNFYDPSLEGRYKDYLNSRYFERLDGFIMVTTAKKDSSSKRGILISDFRPTFGCLGTAYYHKFNLHWNTWYTCLLRNKWIANRIWNNQFNSNQD